MPPPPWTTGLEMVSVNGPVPPPPPVALNVAPQVLAWLIVVDPLGTQSPVQAPKV